MCKCFIRKKGIVRDYSKEGKRLHNIWLNLRNRCNNPRSPDYKYYGGKGITVYDDWKCYFEFKEWSINNGYEPELTIDRIDNNKGYTPENCRWVTRSENSRKAGLSTAFKLRKLSKTEVVVIKNLYKYAKCSQALLGKIFNVSQETVYRIVNNYSYKIFPT